MDIQEKIKTIRRDLSEGGARDTTAAKECVQTLEVVFRDLIQRDLDRLSPEDRERALAAEEKLGKGQKTVPDFTMGQLIGFNRESDFLAAWAAATETDIHRISPIHFAEVNTFRNDLMHKGRTATAMDGFFLLCCLETVHGLFGADENAGDDLPKAAAAELLIGVAECRKAMDDALRVLFERELPTFDDGRRRQFQAELAKLEKESASDSRGIQALPPEKVIPFLTRTGFIKSWLKSADSDTTDLLFINLAALDEWGRELTIRDEDPDPRDLWFLNCCTLFVVDACAGETQKEFIQRLEKAVGRPKRRRRLQTILLSVGAMLLIAVAVGYGVYWTWFDTARFNALARKEADRFFQASRTYFKQSGPPAVSGPERPPPDFKQRDNIALGGRLILDPKGGILGKATFSHARSEAVFILDGAGEVATGQWADGTAGRPVLHDLAAKTAAERLYRTIRTDGERAANAAYDGRHLPPDFTPPPGIRINGRLDRKNGVLSGELTFRHVDSATIFVLNADGTLRRPPVRDRMAPVTGMVFAWIPGGCYEMGCAGEGCFPYEEPAHIACVNGFWMAKRETSQAQWERVMGNNPSLFQKGGAYPAENVAWDEADAFAGALTGTAEGTGGVGAFRLPTEAQWEYACRLGGQTGAESGAVNGPHPVGQSGPDGAGLFEMKDNVLEWCLDAFDADAYKRRSMTDPSHVDDTVMKVVRGRSWSSPYPPCTHRFRYRREERSAEVGVRLVWTGAGLPGETP